MYTTSSLEKKRSGAGQFSPADIIRIELPGGGYGLATIGRLNDERMLCTSWGPRFENIPDSEALDAWVPDCWSSWVADTLGLRDGSWIKVKEPAAMGTVRDIDVNLLPRFKFVSKAGEKKLAEYDPEKLFVKSVIDATDLDEYERAPFLLPQDATTFEAALSNTLSSPYELPDAETVKRLNEEREVVALLRETTSDVNVMLTFDHVLIFKKKREAEKARKELVERGLEVAVPIRSGWFGPTSIEIRLRRKAEYPLVREDVKRVRQIAAYYGVEYDGFGALAL